jgi:hypothetical protein
MVGARFDYNADAIEAARQVMLLRDTLCCSIDALAEAFRPHLPNGLVQEGLGKIREKFASPDHVGPSWLAHFDELTDEDARAIRQRDAYERVNALLRLLGVS